MKKLLYLFIFLFLYSCGNLSEQSVPQMSKSAGFSEEMERYEDVEMEEAPPVPPEAPPQHQATNESEPADNPTPKEKKIIRDGEMQMEVENVKSAKSFVDSTLKKFNAYYERETYESSDYQSSYHLKIRVPANDFDNLINAASQAGGEINLKNINARDVTEQYYDIKTRLENNESYLLQYRSLLKKANSINDILEVQEKIRVLEEEIDSKKGRLKYLSDQVNYSTLNLTLIERHEWQEKNKKGFGEKIIIALKDGGSIFVEFILLVLRLWPFVILIGVVIFLIKRWRKNK
ncbi:MAG: DUF4349 domain-containing protein [Saprospiraceae bacterium]